MTQKTLFDRDLTLEEAEELIKKGNNVNSRCAGSYTPLHLTQNVKMAKLLIDLGADVNAQNHAGRTPLHNALSIDIIKLLVDNHANVNAMSNSGLTPICCWENRENICYLLENGADINATKNGVLRIENAESRDAFFIQHGAVASTIAIYQKRRDLFTEKQKEVFDFFLTLTSNDDDFFSMCLAYQNDQKNHVKMDIKDMEIII